MVRKIRIRFKISLTMPYFLNRSITFVSRFMLMVVKKFHLIKRKSIDFTKKFRLNTIPNFFFIFKHKNTPNVN